MNSLEGLSAKIAKQPTAKAAVEVLLDDLAARIKGTSNDQNIQKLARDLKTHREALVDAVAAIAVRREEAA